MIEPMQTPQTRAEFERRFFLFRESLRHGKVHFNRGLERTIDGILRVRNLPNGRIDFLSVDESARLQVNMMSQFQGLEFEEHINRERAKDKNSE